ncbi:MAG TPA: hypothetical protein VHE34_30980 [Puia sp.]|uniref:hypothetical protein n=1 Tax=Puia sp. TaxID=2045100 RepID=UPI002CBA662D|nr:hypothetical protein [Puia sp.]HVU99701.1 hypothetical protein [Puia sp.]
MSKERNDPMPDMRITRKDVFLLFAVVLVDHEPVSTYLMYPIPVRCSVPVVAVLMVGVVVWMLFRRRRK